MSILSFLLAFIAGSALAGTWKVGDWKGLCLGMSGIDFESFPGSIQPRELRPDENVALKLEWTAGRPEDYTETGTPRVWVPLAAYEKKSFLFLVDGDPSTSTGGMFKTLGIKYWGYPFYFDFGEPLFISRIRFYPRQEGKDELGYFKDYYMKGFMVKVSDGFSFTSKGEPIWRDLITRPENRESVVDLRFPPRLIRFVKITNMRDDPFEIAEVEFYGSGFSLESWYLSKVVDLGQKANFGKVYWDISKWRREGEELVEAPEADVQVEVEGRSGLDPTPKTYYMKGDTVEVTEEEWKSLEPEQRGSVVEDRENWTPWFHLRSGDVFPTPGPRRFFQFRVRISGKLTETARMEGFRLEYGVPLLAEKVVGEVSLKGHPEPPGGTAKVVPGREEVFVYDVRAEFKSGLQKGFDCIKIETPTAPEFVGLEIGGVEPDSVDTTTSGNYLLVRFPRIDMANNKPIRVTFKTSVFMYGTEFRGYVISGSESQIIEPGDANPEVGTNSLRVELVKGLVGDVLRRFSVDPVVTPGRNGEEGMAKISYVITQMDPLSGADVEIGIYDMAGRLVRRLSEGRCGNGIYEEEWDGKDEHGNLVPPGIYICTISVDTDKGNLRRTRSVAVVY